MRLKPPSATGLDVSFGWRERAATYRRRRGRRWQRLVVAAFLASAAVAVLWHVTRVAPWPW